MTRDYLQTKKIIEINLQFYSTSVSSTAGVTGVTSLDRAKDDQREQK